MPTPSHKNRIAGLDGLRGIAAVMVFLEHRTSLSALHLGGYGFHLFFVLSGFLIIGNIVRNFNYGEEKSKLASIRKFFVNRAFRILPIYWLTLAVAALLITVGVISTITWSEWIWNAAFAGNIYVGQIAKHWSRSLSYLWTLAVEEQFYIIAAPIIIISGSKRCLLICASLVGAAIVQEMYLITSGALEVRIVTDSVTSFGMIALGGCLYIFSLKNNQMAKIPTIALLLFYLGLPLIMFSLWRSAPIWIDVFTIPVAAALIAAVKCQPESLGVKILEIKPLAMFGRVSYGFYIYHYWLTSDVLYNLTIGTIDVRSTSIVIQVSVLFSATLMLAAISWVLIEKPMLRLRTRLSGGGLSVRGNGRPAAV